MKITTYQTVWDIMKAVHRRECIALTACIKKEKNLKSINFHQKKLKSGEQYRPKAGEKISNNMWSRY